VAKAAVRKPIRPRSLEVKEVKEVEEVKDSEAENNKHVLIRERKAVQLTSRTNK